MIFEKIKSDTPEPQSYVIPEVEKQEKVISEPEARSRARGCFFLRPKSNTPIQDMPQDNGPVHVECSIISNIRVSAMESELGGLFEN